MKQSNFLSLNWRDLLRAFVVAALAFLFNFLQESFVPALNISPELKLTIITALAYLAKNLGTKPDTKNSIVGDRPKETGGR